MKTSSKILALVMFVSFIGAAYAAVGYDLDGDGIVDAVSTGRWKADWNGDGIIDWRDPWVTSAGARPIAWQDDWSVRGDWRGARDWNGDGIVDWRDDWHVAGERPWNGDWVRADWNRDGVIDFQDGWRRADDFVVGSWDPTWRGEGWRGETVSVREVPSGVYGDTQWATVEGPWDSYGWGANTRLGDWNGDGIVDWKDSFEFNRGVRSGSAIPRATTTRLGDWNGDGIVDWRDGAEFRGGVRSGSALPRGGAVRVSGAKPVVAGTAARPVAAKQPTTVKATTTTAKPAATTGTTAKATTTTGTTAKAGTTAAAKPAGKR